MVEVASATQTLGILNTSSHLPAKSEAIIKGKPVKAPRPIVQVPRSRVLTLVVKLSGDAVEATDGTVAISYLQKFGQCVAELAKVGRVAMTVGGGSRARVLINAALQLGERDVSATLLGGDVGLSNCRLVCAALSACGVDTGGAPVQDWGEANQRLRQDKVPVLFGYWPGLTSDAVAAYFADLIRADLVVKLSRIDAIYDADPSNDSNAHPLRFVSHAQLDNWCVAHDERKAGSRFVVDLLAARRLVASGIPLWLVHLERLSDVLAAVRADTWNCPQTGTLVASARE